MKKLSILGAAIFLLAACQNNTTPTTTTTIGSTQSGVSTALTISYDYDTQDLDATFNNATAISPSNENITIDKEGVYILSGNYTGKITVNVANTQNVKLVLNGATIIVTDGPAIDVIEANKVIVTLANGTTNTITDGKTYQSVDSTNGATAAIYSKGDLTFNGTGTLNVTGQYKNAIQGKDDVVIISGTYNIIGVNDGIKGKDSIKIKDATINIKASGDGIVTTNTENTSKGYIAIENGVIRLDVVNDGIQSITQTEILNGQFYIKTTGLTTDSTASAKGIKSDGTVVIKGGTYTIDTADDGLHAKNVIVSGGNLTIDSADDGIHANDVLTILDGDINVVQSYEALEGITININGGNITTISSDDAINASGTSGNGQLNITGGQLHITSNGDGLDANGNITMSGGVVYVYGPVSGGNGVLDFDGTFTVTGGELIAAGTSNMAQYPNGKTTQTTIATTIPTQTKGTTFQVKDSSGNVVLTGNPTTNYSYIILSSQKLKVGETYTIVVNNQTVATIQATQTVTVSGARGNSFGGGNRR